MNDDGGKNRTKERKGRGRRDLRSILELTPDEIKLKSKTEYHGEREK